jgi:hypothetical protein
MVFISVELRVKITQPFQKLLFQNKGDNMKYLILFFIFLSNLIFSLAQDIEVQPFKFNFIADGITHDSMPFKPEYFVQKNFFITTQWGGNANILKALKFNCNSDHDRSPTSPNLDTNYKMYYIWCHLNNCNGIRGYQFEPTLLIDSLFPFLSQNIF